MLNGQTTVDSIGLMHTRCTHSPDVCWDWLSRVEVHSCMYGQQSDAITSSDILGLSGVESHQNDIITCDCYILLLWQHPIWTNDPNILYNINTKSIEHTLQKKAN